MKVYTCDIPAPEYDYRNFSVQRAREQEAEHQAKVKEWLINLGYTGKNTGKIVSFPVADGYAQYMLADSPKKSCLIHLPYGDAYHYWDVQHLPKAEILKRIAQSEALKKLFAEKKK